MECRREPLRAAAQGHAPRGHYNVAGVPAHGHGVALRPTGRAPIAGPPARSQAELSRLCARLVQAHLQEHPAVCRAVGQVVLVHVQARGAPRALHVHASHHGRARLQGAPRPRPAPVHQHSANGNARGVRHGKQAIVVLQGLALQRAGGQAVQPRQRHAASQGERQGRHVLPGGLRVPRGARRLHGKGAQPAVRVRHQRRVGRQPPHAHRARSAGGQRGRKQLGAHG